MKKIIFAMEQKIGHSYRRRCMEIKQYEIEQKLITVYIMATHVPVYSVFCTQISEPN